MLQTPFCDGAELRQRPLSFSTTARPRIDMLGSRPFIGDDSSRRECDDSLDHDDVGPSLLAFLENVASMSADCSTAHDLSKVSPSRIYCDYSRFSLYYDVLVYVTNFIRQQACILHYKSKKSLQ